MRYGADVDANDVGTLFGEPDGMATALAAPYARDKRHLARKTSCHLASFVPSSQELDYLYT
jgi:hypothetical protein